MARPLSFGKAALTLVGSIIGAGVFGLPIIFARVGFVAGSVLFWLVALLVLATHLLFAEIQLAEKQDMRLPGYAGKWLGRMGYWIMSLVYPVQMVFTSVIYLLLGGQFIAALLFPATDLPLTSWIGTALFAVLGSLVVFVGLKFLAVVEEAATWALIVGMCVMMALMADHVAWINIASSQWSQFFLPFGVFLFALSGIPAIGSVVAITGRSKRASRQAIILGTLGAAFLSWMFGLAIALGLREHPISQPGEIIQALPVAWGWIVPVVGFLAVITSYVVLAQELKTTLRFEWHISRLWAWVLAMIPPYLLLLVVPSDVIAMLGFSGTVFGGINGIFIALIAFQLYRHRQGAQRRMAPLILLLVCVYLIGILTRFSSFSL
ncbi:MAG: aromatic amino acid transport family protein [Patescibacteria group bacterium]